MGKSTLINALLGEEKAGTGGPFPVTLESKYYMTDHLRLWDTQGIELSEESNTKKVLDNTIKIINDSEKKEPDWFIHSIWYCVKGARIEKNEIICIEELMKIYNDETMPIIVLHLNTYNDKEIAEMKDGISKIFENKRIEYLNVLSKEVIFNNQIITKPYGLKELISKTLEKFKNSINSMSFVYVQKKVEESVKNELELLVKNKNFNNISQSICDYFSKLLDFLDENTKIIINTSVANLLLSCKSEIDYSKEIYQNILEFRGNLRNKISLDEINEISKKVENELEMIYNKIKTDCKEYIPSELFRYYVDLVHTLSKDIIWDNLKNIKEDLIQQMKNEIENSPNFKKILQLN